MREDRVVILHNAIAVDAFVSVSQESGPLIRKQLSIPLDAPVVGIVGQVIPLKGHWEFVQAARLVAAKLPQAHFLIVGDDKSTPDPAFLPRLRTYVSEACLDAQVHFLGFRNDVPQIMAALDVLAVPTHDEGFGRVVVEGMAAGRAVVASRVGGIPEIIEHGRTGWLVPAGDDQALAEAVLGLLGDPRRKSALGEVAQQTAMERFDLSGYVKCMEALYLSALEPTLRRAMSSWKSL
jgi:glycosyltransferase involved in cell wall biosynthesis